MTFGWEMALVFQSCVTALASGFNALQFLAYSTHGRRHRRWALFALLTVSLAFLVQSLYLGLLPWLAGLEAEILASASLRFAAGALPMIASVLLLSFILRRWKKRR